MKGNTTTILRRVAKYLLVLAVIATAAFLGRITASCDTTPMPRWPNSPGCQLNDVARYPSANGTDLATILKRVCNMGESVSYFLRLDVSSRRPDSNGWWTIEELQNDTDPVGDPTVIWTNKTIVQVMVSTRTLSGTMVRDEGDDISIIQMYQPREPGAFPNY